VPLMEMPQKRQRHWFLLDGFPELLELYRADALGIDPPDLTAYETIKRLYRHEIATLKLMPKFLLSGDEVMELLNLPPSEKIGEILADIREKQLEGTLKTPEDAKAYLKTFK